MILLAVDMETTWTEPVDPKQARITEIGAVLVDWNTKTPQVIMSHLIHADDYPASPAALVELTGITDDMLRHRGIAPCLGLDRLTQLMNESHYVVAHNGLSFDRPLYREECQRHGLVPSKTPWIDSRTDVPYPAKIKARKLTHLAAEHGFANPFQHRALFDCLTMLKIMEQYDIREIEALAKEPLVKCVAKVSYGDREQAKSRGYYWDGDNKMWWKPLKKSQFDKEKQDAPFVVEQVIMEGI